MSAKKLYLLLSAGLVLLGLCILVGAFEINSMFQSKSHKLVSLEANVDSLNQEQAKLIQDKKDITQNANLNSIAESVVPQDKEPAEAIQQIVNIAAASGIKNLSSITLPSSVLGGAAGPVSSAQANPNSKLNNLSQLTPVKIKGVTGVYTLPITIQQTTDVTYASFISFLKGLEQNRRTAQVSAINLHPDGTDPNDPSQVEVTFTLNVDEYIKP